MVLAALLAGAAMPAWRPAVPAFGAAPTTADADGPALLPLLEAAAQDRWRAGDLAQVAALRRRALRIALAAFGAGVARDGASDGRVGAGAYRSPPLARCRAAADHRRPDAAGSATGCASRRGDFRRAGAGGARPRRRRRGARLGPPRGRKRTARPARTLRPNRCGRSAPRSPRWSASRKPGRALDEALALDRRRHGLEAAETARSLSQLGNLYLRWGRPEDALPLLQEAAAIDQTRLGPAHPFIADDLHDLGLAYEALNRPERARRLFLAALAVLERGSRARHAARRLCRTRPQPRRAATGPPGGGRCGAARRPPHPRRAEAEERRRERRA